MSKKFSDLTQLTSVANNDIMPIDDVSAGTTKKVTVSDLAAGIAPEIPADSITPDMMLGIDLFGVTGAHNGTAPTAGSGQFYIQCGSTVGVFTSNALDISFPTAFPNGLMMVVATNGDSVGVNPITIGPASTNITGFRAQSAVNGTQRVNWIAIGF